MTDKQFSMMTSGDPNTEHIAQVDIGPSTVWVVCRWAIRKGDTLVRLYSQDGAHWSENPAATDAHRDIDYVARKHKALMPQCGF